MAVTPVNKTNPNREWKDFAVLTAAADIDTDGSGDCSVTIQEAHDIQEDYTHVQLEGGYFCSVRSVSANIVTFRVYVSGGAGAAFAAYTTQTDIAIAHILTKGD